MFKRSLFVVMFALCMASQVDAQSMSLGPQFGYQKAKDADEGKLMYGAAIRVKLLPALGGEASIHYRQEEYADGVITVRSWPVMATGLIYFFPMLYGAIGFGWYNTMLDYSDALNAVDLDDETKQKVGWHFGAGVELPLATGARLTGDIRYVFLDYDFEDIPNREDVSSDFYVITVGFLFDL